MSWMEAERATPTVDPKALVTAADNIDIHEDLDDLQ